MGALKKPEDQTSENKTIEDFRKDIIDSGLIETICNRVTKGIQEGDYKNRQKKVCKNKLIEKVDDPITLRNIYSRKENFKEIIAVKKHEMNITKDIKSMTKDFVSESLIKELEKEGFIESLKTVELSEKELFNKDKLKENIENMKNDIINELQKRGFSNIDKDFDKIIEEFLLNNEWVKNSLEKINRYVGFTKLGCQKKSFLNPDEMDETICRVDAQEKLIYYYIINQVENKKYSEEGFSEKQELYFQNPELLKFINRLKSKEYLINNISGSCAELAQDMNQESIQGYYITLCENKFKNLPNDEKWFDLYKDRVEKFVIMNYRDRKGDYKGFSEQFAQGYIKRHIENKKDEFEENARTSLPAFLRTHDIEKDTYVNLANEACNVTIESITYDGLGPLDTKIMKFLYGHPDWQKTSVIAKELGKEKKSTLRHLRELIQVGKIEFKEVTVYEGKGEPKKERKTFLWKISEKEKERIKSRSVKEESEMDFCKNKMIQNYNDVSFIGKIRERRDKYLFIRNRDPFKYNDIQVPFEQALKILTKNRIKQEDEIVSRLLILEAANILARGNTPIIDKIMNNRTKSEKGEYYNDPANFYADIWYIIDRNNGVFPDTPKLRYWNRRDLEGFGFNLGYGTWTELALQLGFEPTVGKRYTTENPIPFYLDIWEFIDKIGLKLLPGRKYFEDESYGKEYSRLYNAANDLYEGLPKVMKNIGMEPRGQKFNTLPEVLVALWDFMDQSSLDTMPSQKQLEKIEGGMELISPIRHELDALDLNLYQFRRLLNYPPPRIKSGEYYRTHPEQFFVDLWAIIDKNSGVFPTASIKELNRLGATFLRPWIREWGGFPTLRELTGFEPLDGSEISQYAAAKGEIAESRAKPLFIKTALLNKYVPSLESQPPIPIRTPDGIKNRRLDFAFWEQNWKKSGDKVYQYGGDITANDYIDKIKEQKINNYDGYHKGVEDIGIFIISNYIKPDDKELQENKPANAHFIHYKEDLSANPFLKRVFNDHPLVIPNKEMAVFETLAKSRPQEGREKLLEGVKKVEDSYKQKKINHYIK